MEQNKTPHWIRNEALKYDGEDFDIFLRKEINDYLSDKDLTDLNMRRESIEYLKHVSALFHAILVLKDDYLLGEREEVLSKNGISIIREYYEEIKNVSLKK